jgi:hypothetical protein
MMHGTLVQASPPALSGMPMEDLFNIFNTPAYGNPSDTSINSNSGYILNARSLGANTPDPRFIQLALMYYF